MRLVVLCPDPTYAETEADNIVALLRDLGCMVTSARFDAGDLDEEDMAKRPPNFVIVDAGDEIERGQRAVRHLAKVPVLSEVPVLITVTVERLPALDFSLGMSDFILKPLVPAELYARLRQLDWRHATFGSDEILKIDQLVIDLSGYEASVRGRKLTLTHQEFELLRFLAQHRGKVFTREQLLKKVWGYQFYGGSRTVDIHVRRLRAKLGPIMGALITTVRQVGYKMKG